MTIKIAKPSGKKDNVSTGKSRGVVDIGARFSVVEKELKGIKQEMATKSDLADIRKEMVDMKEEIIRHFQVAVEHFESSSKGVNEDRLSLLEDGKKEHETRITKLEARAGLRAD